MKLTDKGGSSSAHSHKRVAFESYWYDARSWLVKFMANGPPTPPPTTVTELQDEARGNAIVPPPVVPASAEGTVSTNQDPYQQVFPGIADLASQSNYHDLIQTAEISDLNVWVCV
jgi:hypothetical protein